MRTRAPASTRNSSSTHPEADVRHVVRLRCPRDRGPDAVSSVRPPLIVLEASPVAATREAERLRAAGWVVVNGIGGLTPRGRPIVRAVGVSSAAEAADALLAAIDGAGLIVVATADRATIDRLVDDLRRLGPVDHRIGEPDSAPLLDPDAKAILGLLAEGHSLGEAAALLGIARRTADRRLAAAREALGASRTTEAIARARRLGWFGGGPAGSGMSALDRHAG